MKRCCRCKKLKARSEFTVNQTKKDGLNHSCKECHREYVKAHYRKHTAYYKAKSKNHMLAMIAIADDAKRAPCADCGGTFHPWQMDFDHRPGEKSFGISKTIRSGSVSRSVLLAEIKKCDVVCANCHRDRTHRRGQSITRGPKKFFAPAGGSGARSTKPR